MFVSSEPLSLRETQKGLDQRCKNLIEYLNVRAILMSLIIISFYVCMVIFNQSIIFWKPKAKIYDRKAFEP